MGRKKKEEKAEDIEVPITNNDVPSDIMVPVEMSEEDGKKDQSSLFKALDASLEKAFGHRVVQKLDDMEIKKVPVFSTGSLVLDVLTTIGGFPKGKIVEIFGDESVGKSTLVMHLAKAVQEAGGFVLYIDTENSFDPAYGEKLGISFKSDKFRLVQPETAQEMEAALRIYASSGQVALIIVDSVAAISSQNEQEREVGKVDEVAALARFMSPFIRRINPLMKKSNTLVVFTNQNRVDIRPYGSGKVQPGGKALKFYATVRVELKRKEQLDNGGEPYGIRTEAKTIKNKAGRPFRVGTFDIVWGKGISREAEVMDLGLELGLIDKDKNTFKFNGNSLGVGRNQCLAFLEENSKIRDEIEIKIRELALA